MRGRWVEGNGDGGRKGGGVRWGVREMGIQGVSVRKRKKGGGRKRERVGSEHGGRHE